MSLPSRQKKKAPAKGGLMSRMKTTVAVKDSDVAIEKDTRSEALKILDVSQTFKKDLFPFQEFFLEDLNDFTEELHQLILSVQCNCGATTSLDHVYRLRPEGGGSLTATEDLSPLEYLKRLNMLRRDQATASSYNDNCMKVVKRYGNVISHLLDVHLENMTVEQHQRLWNEALILIHFRKVFKPAKLAKSEAYMTLAATMAVLNTVRKDNGLPPLRNYINPSLITKTQF